MEALSLYFYLRIDNISTDLRSVLNHPTENINNPNEGI